MTHLQPGVVCQESIWLALIYKLAVTRLQVEGCKQLPKQPARREVLQEDAKCASIMLVPQTANQVHGAPLESMKNDTCCLQSS
jgi:hypothetical protein